MAIVANFGVGDGLGTAAVQAVDISYGAARASIRPVDHALGGNILGHYRSALLAAGGVASISAAGILYSFTMPLTTSNFCVIERISMSWEIITAITAATPVDFSAFVFRGCTGNSAGASSTLGTPSRMRGTHSNSMISNAPGQGEFRALNATTALTAATGKTNDTSPFAYLSLNTLLLTNSTGTVVTQSVGACLSGDLYKYDTFSQHPLVLAKGEGFEIQARVANNTTGTVALVATVEWAEVAAY